MNTYCAWCGGDIRPGGITRTDKNGETNASWEPIGKALVERAVKAFSVERK